MGLIKGGGRCEAASGTSAANSCLDGRDVNLLHGHHGVVRGHVVFLQSRGSGDTPVHNTTKPRTGNTEAATSNWEATSGSGDNEHRDIIVNGFLG